MAFTINIVREAGTLEGTPGRLVTSAGYSCDTLELFWENNQADISCVFPDTYNATLFNSPHFGHLVVRLENRFGRVGCELHNATWASDVAGEAKQLDGCTAVGHGFGLLVPPGRAKPQLSILSSVATLSNLIDHIISQVGEDGTFTVTYAYQDGCEPADLRDLNPASSGYAG